MDPTFRGVDGRWRLLPVFQRQKKTTNSPQNLNLINAPPIRKQKQQDKCFVRIKQVNAYPSVLEQAFLLRSLMYFRTKDHSNYVRSDTRTFSDVRHESRRLLTSVTTFSPFLSSVTTFSDVRHDVFDVCHNVHVNVRCRATLYISDITQ
jgi:hypothetical protein